jgi:WD40 repeat protein
MARRIFTSHCSLALAALMACLGTGRCQEQPQADDELAECWQRLGDEDAQKAYRAMAQLVRDPDGAVRLLGERLKIAEAPDFAQIDRWLKDLSNGSFAVRERAFQGLRALGEFAEQPLRKALEGKLELESKRRIESLLGKLDERVTSPEKLRQIRGVEVLEMLATPAAKAVLERLAKGRPEQRQTRDAQESLSRLTQRKAPPERWLAWAKALPARAEDDRLPFGAGARMGTLRFRHEAAGGSGGAFSPDGRLIFSHDKIAVYVWQTETGLLERKFPIKASCLAVAPKETLLALGTAGQIAASGAVVCWDWQLGKERHRLELPPGIKASEAAFSPDGAKVVFKTSDEKLRAWDIKTGDEATLWEPSDGLDKLRAFSPDGRVIVASTKTAHFVLDLQKQEKHALPSMEREPRRVVISANAKCVALGGDHTQEVLFCDAETGKILWRTGKGVGPIIYSACFSADGKVVAVGSYRQEVSLWDIRSGQFLKSLDGSFDSSVSAISSDGRSAVGGAKSLNAWDLATGRSIAVEKGHRSSIESLTLSPHYDWIATNDYSTIHLWDAVSGKHKHQIDTGGTFVRSVAVSPDRQWIAAANPGPGEGFLKVWEASTGRQVYALASHAVRDYGSKTDVRFSPDGRYLFSWGDDHFLRKWDVKTGRALLEISTGQPGSKLKAFDFDRVQQGWTNSMNRFMMLKENGDLHTYDLNLGKEGPVLKMAEVPFLGSYAFSPTGRYLAYGESAAAAVMDTNSGQRIFAASVPGRASRLLFSPDSRAMAVAAADKVVVLEIATGKARLSFDAKTHAFDFSADGRFLAAAMDDTTALLWDLTLLAAGEKR